MNPASEPPASVAFGRFRVLPQRRELLADGRPIRLGGRAFDVLMALIEARGAVVGKDALMQSVWPDRIVEDNSLQAQISVLRAAFGAERELIRTVAGRGYQFIGEIRIVPASPDEPSDAAADPAAILPPTNLPEPVSELIGRDDDLDEILGLAAAHRLVTLTGAGGIGKTRLSLEVARPLLPEFADGVWAIELAPLVRSRARPGRRRYRARGRARFGHGIAAVCRDRAPLEAAHARARQLRARGRRSGADGRVVVARKPGSASDRH